MILPTVSLGKEFGDVLGVELLVSIRLKKLSGALLHHLTIEL